MRPVHALVLLLASGLAPAQEVDAWLGEAGVPAAARQQLQVDDLACWVAGDELCAAARVTVAPASHPDARAHAERLARDAVAIRARLGLVVHAAIEKRDDLRLPLVAWRAALRELEPSLRGRIGPGGASAVRVIGDVALAVVRAPRAEIEAQVENLPPEVIGRIYRAGLLRELADLETARRAPQAYLDAGQEARRIGIELTPVQLVGVATAFAARDDAPNARAIADHVAGLDPVPEMTSDTWLALADVERTLGRTAQEAHALRAAERTLDRELGLSPIDAARVEDFRRPPAEPTGEKR